MVKKNMVDLSDLGDIGDQIKKFEAFEEKRDEVQQAYIKAKTRYSDLLDREAEIVDKIHDLGFDSLDDLEAQLPSMVKDLRGLTIELQEAFKEAQSYFDGIEGGKLDAF